MNDNKTSKLLTISAFVIGFALIDDLNSNEQNALGNCLMLIGQVLCTNGSEYFKRDWNNYLSGNNVSYNNSNTKTNANTKEETDKEYTLRMLSKTKEAFEREINKLK